MVRYFKYSIVLVLVFLQLSSIAIGQTAKNKTTQEKQLPRIDSFPKPSGYVNDFASLYSIEQRTYLERVIAEFEAKTSVEIALVTLSWEFKSTEDFDNYTLTLARKWGVGKKGKDNGILIGINPKIRYMRIQNGFGIETILSDAETKTIVDKKFIPSFKSGDYYKGTLDGIEAIIMQLTKEMK